MAGTFLLVVDDDPDDRAFIVDALASGGASVRLAADGQEALDLLLPADGSAPPLPAAVLLDLMMPRVSGLEVLERLRADARTRAVPVVIFSSSQETGDVRRAYALGANGYVAKPVDPDEFRAAVAEAAAYWTHRNIAPPPAAGP